MTRSERIHVACERFAEGRPDERAETVDQGIEAALDAALADIGGLDGLEATLADMEVLDRESARLARDRDGLRSLLSSIASNAHVRPPSVRLLTSIEEKARYAVRESKAGDGSPGWEQTDATIDLADLAAHADRLADCLEALIRNRKPHTHWLDEGLDALTAYRDATS